MEKQKELNNILSIESAVGEGSVALLSKQRGTFVKAEGNECSRAEKLLTVISGLLSEAELVLRDLDMIAVSNGPGSYSGIRIGLSTALGLGNALNIPCVGVSVLEAMANGAPFPGPIIVAIPVGKNDAAWQTFGSAKDGRRIANANPELISSAGFGNKLMLLPGSILFAQSNLLERHGHLVPDTTRSTNAGTALAEFVGRFASMQDEGPRTPRPIYLQNVDAPIRENIY